VIDYGLVEGLAAGLPGGLEYGVCKMRGDNAKVSGWRT
jgi:hypothetical protein